MVILASQSPRRKELLKKIIPDFKIVPADVDEHLNVAIRDLPKEAALLKARTIKKEYPNDDVLGCDTVVIINDELLGKPKDEIDAYRMLKELSGKKHEVISGYAFLTKDKEITGSSTTIVEFNELSDELIWRYIKSGSPMDKAGAYGIQDKQFNLVKQIHGSLDNVIGLPTEDIKKTCF